jgi:hypothetical protein
MGRSGDRIPTESKTFSVLQTVQTGSGGHPVANPMYNRDSYPGVQAPGRVLLRLSMETHLYSPIHLCGLNRENFTFGCTFQIGLVQPQTFVRCRAFSTKGYKNLSAYTKRSSGLLSSEYCTTITCVSFIVCRKSHEKEENAYSASR